MTVAGRTFTAATLAWYLGILVPIFTWLATLPSPITWGWTQWCGNLAILLGLIVAKLAPGLDKAKEDSISASALKELRKGPIITALLITTVMLTGVASAQAPAKPNIPPSLPNCQTADWQWNAEASRWDATCVAAQMQVKPSLGPDMGLFCGKADWEWAPGENRWVATCNEKSALAKTIQISGITLGGISFGQSIQAAQEGRPVDPLAKPFISRPWLASGIQVGMNFGQLILGDELFKRHPTLATVVNIAMTAYRAIMVTYVAMQEAEGVTPTPGTSAAVTVAIRIK